MFHVGPGRSNLDKGNVTIVDLEQTVCYNYQTCQPDQNPEDFQCKLSWVDAAFQQHWLLVLSRKAFQTVPAGMTLVACIKEEIWTCC